MQRQCETLQTNRNLLKRIGNRNGIQHEALATYLKTNEKQLNQMEPNDHSLLNGFYEALQN